MRIVFMGTPESAVPTLARCVEDGHEVVAVWTQPDRPAGRGNKLVAPPVKEFALARGLAVYQPSKIRTDETYSHFASHEADACVVVAYGRILPRAYLHAAHRGCVNVHFSLLPKYRGAAPVNWAIVRGEQESGVTTMLMDEGLDTGPILLQRATRIGDTETAPELLARLSTDGAELLSETLQRLDEIEPRAQDGVLATHAPVMKREDGRIDWTQSASDIERRVRGFQPWPNAHALFRGQRFVVWRATPEKKSETANDVRDAPGSVVSAHGDELTVACGEGSALRLLEVQAEGKRRMLARDFLNGTRVEAGEIFG